ncbi:hypothetical protein [Streptomyces sp. NPDC002566]|uniref:hypothetical protein n=1 Tax=Streptomyces sp. NPDC002566 TaxID=3364650 RepID=UPI0036B92645
MSTPHRDRLVVCIDLRRGLDHVGTAAALDERFRETMREARVRAADVSRVLVIDTAADLVSHEDAYERICSHPGVSAVLCLAVGPPAARSAGPAADPADAADEPYRESHVLALPVQLRPPLAATVWVGDVRGIGWRPGQSGAPALTDTGAAENDLGGLDPLVELLQVAEVFDETVGTLHELPSAVASPALRLLIHEVPEEELLRTQVQALEYCTGAPTAVTSPAPPEGPLAVLAGTADPEDLSSEDCLPEDSPLRQSHRQTVAGMRRAGLCLAELSGRRGWLGRASGMREALGAVREAGHRLAEHRRTIEQTFEWVDGRAGIDAEARDHLLRLGVRLPLVPGTRPEEVGAALRQQVLTRLERRRPLPEIVSWLREFTNSTVPSGSAAQIERIQQVCPDDVLAPLIRPPAFTVGAGAGRAAGWAALAASAAAVAPWWPLVSGVMLLLLAGAVGWTLVAGPEDEASDEPPWAARLPRRTVGVLAGGWAAGCVVGLSARAAVAMPFWSVWLLAVAAGAAAVQAGHSLWAAAVADWRREVRLDAAALAAERLGEALDDGVFEYWLLADARAAASDQARAVAALLEAGCSTLAEFGEQLEGRAGPDWGPASRGIPPGGGTADGRGGSPYAVEHVGQAGQALLDTVIGDLSDLMAEVLTPYWPLVLRDPSTVTALPVAARTGELIFEYQHQLARVGTAPAPRFAHTSVSRPDPASLVGVDMQRVVGVLLPGHHDDALHLCSPGQLRMLDRAPDATRHFGFVPQAMQSSFWKAVENAPGGAHGTTGGRAEPRTRWTSVPDAGLPDIVWTATGRFAGLLRLVPLAESSVRLSWSDGRESTGGAGGAPRPGGREGGRLPGARDGAQHGGGSRVQPGKPSARGGGDTTGGAG